MTFKDYWKKLNEKKKIDGDVKLTPAQFEKMLEQAYDIGYKAGGEQAKKIREMLDQYAGRGDGSNTEKIKDKAFDELLNKGGNFGDILSGFFGKKKT